MGKTSYTYYKITEESRYFEQQRYLDELAKELGVVCYRPDYHAKNPDKNTVLFYTKEDHEYNTELDKNSNFPPMNEEYRRHFWSFENTDINGRLDFGFANLGSIDLRGLHWKDKIRPFLMLALCKKLQNDYIRRMGGILEIKESDFVYNDFNRMIVERFYECYDNAFIGKINYKGDTAWAKKTGGKPLKKYNGENVCNFGCDFIVKRYDEELEDMITRWNSGDVSPENPVTVEMITRRIENLSGVHFTWF